jgi:hypothetical protein
VTDAPAEQNSWTTRAAAWLVTLAACARVIVHGVLDRRPRFGGSEANDLYDLARHHWALRGWLADDLATGLLEDRYKPPLYYAGVPLLFGWRPTLDYAGVLAVNAVALALALAAAWELGRRLGGRRAALWAVVVTASLPAVAGRVTVAGVEPLHLALVGWSLVGLLQLRRRPGPGAAVALGAVLATGMLIKWTFVAAVGGAIAVAGVAALVGARSTGANQGDSRARAPVVWLAVALGVGGAAFGAWFVLVGQPGSIAAGAAHDPTTSEFLGSSSILYLARWATVHGVGAFGAAAVALGAVGLMTGAPGGGRVDRWLLAAAALGLLVAHTLIPHKEARYLLPAFGPLAVLVAVGLARLGTRGRGWRLAVVGATLALLVGTFTIAPRGGDPAHTHLRLAIDPDDQGVEALVRQVAGDGEEPVLVASSLAGERWMELRDMLAWELYARADRPVLLLPPERDLRWQHARDKLSRAQRFLADGPPSAEDRAALRRAGFVRVRVLSAPGGARLELWSRPPPHVSAS